VPLIWLGVSLQWSMPLIWLSVPCLALAWGVTREPETPPSANSQKPAMPWVSQTAGTSQLGNPHHHLGASWCGWGEGKWITLHPVGKDTAQRHVQLLSLLENCSCNSSALQSTQSHGSQDPTVCLSGRKAGLLCALVVLLKQSIHLYQKSLSSDAHKAKTS